MSQIKRNRTFQGKLDQALQAYVGKDEKKLASEFWHSDAIATALKNADNASKSLKVLRKHLPERFHTFIRFAQPNIIWYLNVEKGVIATQLNIILDDLLLRIAKDIGYAPRIKVSLQPSHKNWTLSGFPLKFPEKVTFERPDEKEAQEFLKNFIKK